MSQYIHPVEVTFWWWSLTAEKRAMVCTVLGGNFGHACSAEPPQYVVQAVQSGRIRMED